MQLTFNKRSILPDVYKKDDKVYFSTTLFTPVRYNIKFGQGLISHYQRKTQWNQRLNCELYVMT
ncbi:hypothetical protein QDT66_17485, partial [Acinetobacter baumannii]|nr:hypothetical protein [Acinetobacter baumannii]